MPAKDFTLYVKYDCGSVSKIHDTMQHLRGDCFIIVDTC
jgi:hypothetical protein